MTRASDANHGYRPDAFRGGECEPRAECGRIAGDDLAGAGGRASGAQHVGGQRRAAPAVGVGGRGPEPGWHRHVADRCLDAWHGREPGGERGAHTVAFAEEDVVVGADPLLPGHDRRGGAVALDGRMGAQDRLELHAPGGGENGGGGEQRSARR